MHELSRRDFLKVTGLGFSVFAFRDLQIFDQERAKSSLNGMEIESRILANKIPVLQYHYPGYSDAHIALPEDFFNSQIKYLVDGGYRTVSDKEFELFLDGGNKTLPAKTVALRINRGAASFDEFEKMIGVLKANGFSAWQKQISNNTAPSFYPYVSQNLLEITKANPSNNPLAYFLINGYTFDELIRMNTTPVTVPEIEKILKLKEPYPEISFGKINELPVSDAQKKFLIRPVGIIIHTDGQPGGNFKKWTTGKTYNGLYSRGLDTHFSIGLNGISQFLKMYKDFCMFTKGARGFANYISIEMCGRDYDSFFNKNIPLTKKKVIEMITVQTIVLVKKLIRQYDISINNVLGHYQASASGKTDPGKVYMEKLFLPLLNSSVPLGGIEPPLHP